jgi:hypothetical protein
VRRGIAALFLLCVTACGAPATNETPLASASPGDPPTTSLPAAPSGGPAECSHTAYEEAVAREIDGGNYRISDERCNGDWAAFDVDFGVDACPPEDNSCAGERVHRTFWRNEGGMWKIITYQGSGDCAEVWRVERRFPEAICRPR